MEKCFWGLAFGVAMALAYFADEIARAGVSLNHCISGMLEWVFIGGCMTVCAIIGYALWHLTERLT